MARLDQGDRPPFIEIDDERPADDDLDYSGWVVGVDGYRFICCDCGLVHSLRFRVNDNEVEFQVARDEELTERERAGLLEAPSE